MSAELLKEESFTWAERFESLPRLLPFLILIGMIMLAVGFNFRDKPLGVFGMWIGMLLILGTVVYKILAKLAE